MPFFARPESKVSQKSSSVGEVGTVLMPSPPSQEYKIIPEMAVHAEEGLENEPKDAKISPLLGLTVSEAFPHLPAQAVRLSTY